MQDYNFNFSILILTGVVRRYSLERVSWIFQMSSSHKKVTLRGGGLAIAITFLGDRSTNCTWFTTDKFRYCNFW